MGETQNNDRASMLMIENAINTWYEFGCDAEMLATVFRTIAEELKNDIKILTAIELPMDEIEAGVDNRMNIRTIGDNNGNVWMVAFTSEAEIDKGEHTESTLFSFRDLINIVCENEEYAGILINPWDKLLQLPKYIIGALLKEITPPAEDVVELSKGNKAYQAKEYEIAVSHYKASIELGNVTAMSCLGICYYYGHGVELDKEQARICFEKAAILGNITAIYMMGDMFRNGDLPEDLVYSTALYKKAFDIALKEGTIINSPDVYMRMMWYCEEDFAKAELEKMASECVNALEARINQGDTHSDELLAQAKELVRKYENAGIGS